MLNTKLCKIILPINFVKYQLEEELGYGMTSRVYKAFTVKDVAENAQPYAIKQVNPEFPNCFDNEITCLENLNHKNIIKMIDFMYPSIGSPRQLILLEYCEYEFFNLIKLNGGLPENIACFYLQNLVSAVDHIHKRGFCHRDIKLDNIFLTSKYELKLADFSFGCYLEGEEDDHILTEKVGSTKYMAPEVFEQQQYKGEQVDIFSIGVTLFLMVMAKHPFSKPCYSDVQFNLFQNYPEEFWSLYTKQPSNEFKDLIQKVLKFNPNERLSISEIISSSWVNKFDNLSQQDIHKQFSNGSQSQ